MFLIVYTDIYIHAESMFAVTWAAEAIDQKQEELQEQQSL
jgi:hypothetical protein